MNKVIKLLMLSDIFAVTGFGLIDPILSIYWKEDLAGGTIFAAGFASTLFLITKSLVQLPFSKHVDRYDDENDLKWLIVGTGLIALVPFLYILAENILMVYLAQIIYGIGSGLAYPAWLGLWTTHLDKRRESFEWSLYSTTSGIGAAVTAAIGAALAQFIGFTYTFVFVGILAMIGCFILINLKMSHLSKK